MTTIEITAKKVDDAIKQGLEQLGASLDEVRVEVLESGGLFRKAKVRLTLEKDEPQAQAAEPAPKAPEASAQEKPEKSEKQAKSEKAEKTEAQPKPVKPVKSERAVPTKTNNAPAQKAQPKKAAADNVGEQQKPAAERHAKSDAESKEAVAKATQFITELIGKMGFEGVTVESDDNGNIGLTAAAGDDSLIIGRHGETLSAISFLAETLGRAEKQHVNIVVDCNGYRERRAASLTAMAHRKADECVTKRRKIKLEPMERIDRRTIHNALTDDTRVTTSSEGKEPYRCVVILPKRQQQQ